MRRDLQQAQAGPAGRTRLIQILFESVPAAVLAER